MLATTRVSNLKIKNSSRSSTRPKRTIHTSIFKTPHIENEPVKEYREGSKETKELLSVVKQLRDQKLDIPIIIGGKEIRTGDIGHARIPHEHKHVLATYHRAGKKEMQMAINSALEARQKWERTDFYTRASIILRIADLISGPYRNVINASTILGQSKNFFQAEIDSICETVDFARFNVKYLEWIMQNQQPESIKGVWNRLSFRALEGFVLAVSPFNFTAIASNLCLAPVLCGNTVVWKNSESSMLSNYYLMKVYEEAGLPPGIINFVPGTHEPMMETAIPHKELAGIHFTGSTSAFENLWKNVGQNINHYRSFPRLVGETGGKDFVAVHPSADERSLAVALIRGAFEFAGQKCSAASRAYVPKGMWGDLETMLLEMMGHIHMGNPEKVSTFVNAVINRNAYDKCASYIDHVKENPKEFEIVYGGNYDDSVGYFIQPTIVISKSPHSKLMREEIFGPILTIHLYDENAQTWESLLDTVNEHQYALTGSIFSHDIQATNVAIDKLRHACGNLYLNDKPTGAMVNQQPFGGSRKSGTNDKAGSYLNLLRWMSPQTMKTTLIPPTEVLYPYMK